MASGCVSTSRSLLPARSWMWSSKRSARKWCSSRPSVWITGAHRAVEHEDALAGELRDRVIGERVGAGDGHATPFSAECAVARGFVRRAAIGSVVAIVGEPDGDGEPVVAGRRREVTDVGTVEAGSVEPVADLVVVEAEATVRLRVAEELVAVRGEVDDEQPAAGCHEACRFDDRPGRIVEVVEHLVDRRRGRSWPRRRGGLYTSPCRSSYRSTPLRSRFARATDSIEWLASMPDRTDGARTEQLEDASRAGAEVERAVRPVAVADHVDDRRLDGRLRGVQRSLLVPDRCDLFEVLVAALSARRSRTLASRLRSAAHHRIAVVERLERAVEHRQPTGPPSTSRKKTQVPSRCLATTAGVDEQLEVTRHPRLRLAEDLGQVGDREFRTCRSRATIRRRVSSPIALSASSTTRPTPSAHRTPAT